MPTFKEKADAWLAKNNGLTTLIFLGLVIVPIIWLLASQEQPDTPAKKSNNLTQANSASEGEIIVLLDTVGKKISEKSENHAIIYVDSFRVSEAEIPAYKSIFRTSHEALMSHHDADKDMTAYYHNVGRTEAWQAAFCRPEIRDAIKKYNLSVISANLENEDGEIQSMAVCVLRN